VSGHEVNAQTAPRRALGTVPAGPVPRPAVVNGAAARLVAAGEGVGGVWGGGGGGGGGGGAQGAGE